MTGTADDGGTMTYTAQEVVGVFASAGALETAVGELERAGVGRAALSVLGIDTARSGRIAELYHAAEATMDDPSARRAAFVSRETRVEGEVLAIGVPLEIGGFAGAWAVAAGGGALITAIGAALAGGAVGAGLGVLLFQAVARCPCDHPALGGGGYPLPRRPARSVPEPRPGIGSASPAGRRARRTGAPWFKKRRQRG